MKKFDNSRLSVELLRQRVAYDPDTGQLTWLPCSAEHFVDARSWKSWTTRFAGKPVEKRRRGYVVVSITVDRVPVSCEGHRVAWALMTGAWPEHEVDHLDRDRSNNRWSNLRKADHQRNQWNKGIGRRNSSGFKGVHRHSQNDRWIAQIAEPTGKTKHLGCFATAEEASIAYRSADAAIHGEFSATQGASV